MRRMTKLTECLFLISVVSSVACFPYPISQPGPGYQSPQYTSAQALPQLTYRQPQAAGYREQPQAAISQPGPGYQSPQYTSAQALPQLTYRQPQAAGYREQPQAAGYREQLQYVRQPPSHPVYEPKGGLQNYASNGRSQIQNPQASPQIYLNQINPSHLASQAQEAFLSAAKKPAAQVYQPQSQQTYQPEQSFKPVAVQLQYQPQANPQYSREQPQQISYVSRPVKQYRVQQATPQPEDREEIKEKEDYDVSRPESYPICADGLKMWDMKV